MDELVNPTTTPVCRRPNTSRKESWALPEGSTALENTPTPASQPPQNNRPILRIGHRGAAGHAPENTLAAIRTGIALGSDFVEVDVQSTRDGRLVLMHDASVDRTTNGAGLVSELTWDAAAVARRRQRRAHPLRRSRTGSGQRTCRRDARNQNTRHRTSPVPRRPSVRLLRPGHLCVLPARGDPRHPPDSTRVARTLALIECVPSSGAAFAHDACAVARWPLVRLPQRPQFIATLHAAGLEVFLYTVNEPSLIRHAIRLGADGIISDYPDRVPKTRPPEDSR